MANINKIDFFCWESYTPKTIVLEPEAFEFTIAGKDILTFVGISHGDNEFKWAIRAHNDIIQLYPEGKEFDVEVYKNGEIVPYWT